MSLLTEGQKGLQQKKANHAFYGRFSYGFGGKEIKKRDTKEGISGRHRKITGKGLIPKLGQGGD